MKHPLLVLALASAGVVGLGDAAAVGAGLDPATGTGISNPAEAIRSASDVLFTEPQPSRDALQKALTDLLRSASRISRDADLPAPIPERTAAAAASYERGAFLERAEVALVHSAYEAVAGDAFVFPPDVGTIPEATEHGRKQIQAALGALDAGRSREAVQDLLGFVLLVTTPQKRHE